LGVATLPTAAAPTKASSKKTTPKGAATKVGKKADPAASKKTTESRDGS
jgi:hypothetical protein